MKEGLPHRLGRQKSQSHECEISHLREEGFEKYYDSEEEDEESYIDNGNVGSYLSPKLLLQSQG